MAEMETSNLVQANGQVRVHKRKKSAPTASLMSKEQAAARRRQREANLKYGRGQPVATRGIRDKKVKREMHALESRYETAAHQAHEVEILRPHTAGTLEAQGPLERTYKVRQPDVRAAVDVETAKKGFELRLEEGGPYVCEYTRNGRDLLLAGRGGHVATMEWRAGRLGCELRLGEEVAAATWLHNNQYFAVAQARGVFVYDRHGVELHHLAQHVAPRFLEFLPYHFLLASVGATGGVRWQDTSTGTLVAQAGTKQGAPTALAQNPYNAMLHVGHQNGTVSLWSPSSPTPAVKMLCHRGPVRALAVDRQGRYMVSTGQDLKMAVWDVRAFRPLHSYGLRAPGASLAVSDRQLTAVGWGTHTTVWKDLFTRSADDVGVADDDDSHAMRAESRPTRPYMSWGAEGRLVEQVRWCPYEDVLGIGHDAGFSSMLVPGAGEPHFDALEANPYETPGQRQEAEVQALLHKLTPEMIQLDPHFVGTLDQAAHQQQQQRRPTEKGVTAEATTERQRINDLAQRGRGKNSALRTYLRKRGRRNVVDEHTERARELREEQRRAGRVERAEEKAEALGPALGRFVREKRKV